MVVRLTGDVIDDSTIYKYIKNSEDTIGYALLTKEQLKKVTSLAINQVIQEYYNLLLSKKVTFYKAKDRISLDNAGYNIVNNILKRVPIEKVIIAYILLALYWCVSDGKLPIVCLNPTDSDIQKILTESKKSFIQKVFDNYKPVFDLAGSLSFPFALVAGLVGYMLIKPYFNKK